MEAIIFIIIILVAGCRAADRRYSNRPRNHQIYRVRTITNKRRGW